MSGNGVDALSFDDAGKRDMGVLEGDTAAFPVRGGYRRREDDVFEKIGGGLTPKYAANDARGKVIYQTLKSHIFSKAILN